MQTEEPAESANLPGTHSVKGTKRNRKTRNQRINRHSSSSKKRGALCCVWLLRLQEVALVTDEADPAGQGVHETDPSEAAYEPMGHTVQIVLPEGLATGVAEPAGHRSHEDCPSFAEYVPALQEAQLA